MALSTQGRAPTAADDYWNWVRVLDHHGILHLARMDMMPGEVLCGSPPVGCRLSDPVGAVALAGDRTPLYQAICGECSSRAHPMLPTPQPPVLTKPAPVAVETLFDDL